LDTLSGCAELDNVLLLIVLKLSIVWTSFIWTEIAGFRKLFHLSPSEWSASIIHYRPATLKRETIHFVFDLLLLLLIGMGPKIALVPFLDATEGVEPNTQRKIASIMVFTAVGTVLVLVALGWFLMRLLHFTPGAANVAGGIVLLLLALQMLASPSKEEHHEMNGRDLLKMASYPLAVPYLPNPAGIVTLVIASSEINSIVYLLVLVGLVLFVGALDWLVFRNMGKLSKFLDPSRLAVTEAVFGVLLAALAVQLMLDGLADLGVLDLVAY
jgi:multiple antibiotic resistance protein